MGVFNEILAHFEKDGIRPYNSRRAELFRDFLNVVGLMELEMKGCSFTWISNPRNGMTIKEKLDRILVNWPWHHMHPNVLAIALPIVSSDHSPLVFSPCLEQRSGVSFNFELYWAEHADYFGVVEKEWGDQSIEGEPWQNFSNNLKASKRALQRWHRNTFRRADGEICKLKQN